MEANRMSLEETLLPAFFQCFGIMLLGYVLGRSEILGQKEAKGISKFVQYLALPALIFGTICTMPFSNVKWEFVASIFVSKACVFVCVVLMTILLTHPADLGKSGIYAIATTQSNDFALAYPMFMSLYKNSHPEFSSYLYIVAPIQLVVLNTIGFFIIETQKQKFDTTTKCHAWKVLIETLKNPVVFMTLFGMICNVSFGNKMLPIFSSLLQTLSAAFPATALLLLGHTMATKGKKPDNHIPIVVALLIITKNLILPIVMQKFTSLMLRGSSESEIQSFSSFAFLYGTTPTAPTAYVFAVQYDVSVDVITKTVIGSTLLSAPLMFASASVISLSEIGLDNIKYYLSSTIQYLSCASLLCCGWLLLSFILGKRFRDISFGVTLYIFFSQFLMSLGGILLFCPLQEHSAGFYAQYILSTGGIYATRVCTLFLAVLLLIIRWRSLCYILQVKKHINVISALCVIVPFSIATMLLFSKNIKTGGPNTQLGQIQNITTFVLTLICFSGTVLCLILQHVCFRNKCDESPIERINYESPYQAYGENVHILPRTASGIKKTVPKPDYDEEISVDVEDLHKHFENLATSSDTLVENENSLCDSRYQCSIEKRLRCASRVSTYIDSIRESGLYEDQQIFQHMALLIILSIAMTLSLTVCFWRLIMEKMDGIYVELEFLDTIINYSFGVLLFIIFGSKKGLIYTILNKLKTLRCCKNNTDIEISSADICQNFITNYGRKFQIDMNDLKTNHRKYSNVFCSSDIIQWLLYNKIVESNDEAERYIVSLQEGHIIESVDKCTFFPESELLFRLTYNQL